MPNFYFIQVSTFKFFNFLPKSEHSLLDLSQLYFWRWNAETHIFILKQNVYKVRPSIILGWKGKALGVGEEQSIGAN